MCESVRYHIDIVYSAKLFFFSKEGCVCETEAGYTFFWKGKAENEDRIHRVELAVRTTLLRQITALPTGINEHLMKS